MLKRSLILICIACLMVCGCEPDSIEEKKPDIKVNPIVESSWLRDRVPTEALAYLRIPNAWNFFSATEDSFRYAQSNPPHIAQIQQLQSAVLKRVEEELPDHTLPVVKLLLQHLTSPLEIAVLPPKDSAGSSVPTALISASVDFESTEALNTFLQSLTTSNPMVVLSQPVNKDGHGTLQIGFLQVMFRFDQQRLNFLVGMAVQASDLIQLIDKLPTTPPPIFSKLEQEVDSNGKGAFVWINSTNLTPIAQTVLPPDTLQQAQRLGLLSIEHLAIGMGTANGKQRFRLAIAMPDDVGIRRYLPIPQHTNTISTVGTPRFIYQMSLPNGEQLQGIINEIGNTDPSFKNEFANANQKMRKTLGITLNQWFDTFGELIIFKDDLGYFGAQRIRDKQAFRSVAHTLLNGINQLDSSDLKTGDLAKASGHAEDMKFYLDIAKAVKVDKRTIGDVEVFHLLVPSLYGSAFDNVGKDNPFATTFTKAVMGGNTHVYWTIEQDYVVFSALPQDLIERANADKTDSLKQWLSANGLNQSQSLVSLNGAFASGKRSIYHNYLTILQALADSVNADFDIFAFPVASELDLNTDGMYSLQVDNSEDLLAFEIAYEQTPLDILLMSESSMTTVAVVGILAAVAIPAYQDYTIRSKVAKVLSGSQTIKTELTQFYYQHGRFPSEEELKDLQLNLVHPLVASMNVEANKGSITIELFNGKHFFNKSIYFRPDVTNAGIVFKCSSDIENKHLPSECKSD